MTEPLVRLIESPTPVRRVDALCTERVEFWLKNDGLAHALYGGNKVRKLEGILSRALHRGAKRLVTSGAAGSHHVLATTLFARRVGLEVLAILCPQPRTAHSAEVLKAIVASGCGVLPVSSRAHVPWATLRALRRGDYLVPPGGSSVWGNLGYVNAVREIIAQIDAGDLPTPDVIVAPLGSGGTVAGLLAGCVREGLPTTLLGVNVATPGAVGRALVLGLGRQALAEDGGQPSWARLSRALEVESGFLGSGYGEPTLAGDEATLTAAALGITLDPTYTAKTFACALERQRSAPRHQKLLYLHTLSCAPLTPALSEQAPALGRELSRLLPQPHRAQPA